MNIKSLLQRSIGSLALNDLVFTDINDSPDNPRLGLGYHQLYDPTKFVGLIAKLPDVTRVGDTITLYWDGAPAQIYDLDQPTIDKGWLSFSVSPSQILDPQGQVYYTLLDHVANDLQTSATRTIVVNRRVPGGLDPDTDTAINEAMVPCTVNPDPVSNPATVVTVTVPAWLNQEIGDELTVMWNNTRVVHPRLTALGPQNVVIPPDVLAAGGSSDQLLVNYEIRDIVDNYSLVSPATYVRVEIDPNALPAPRVDEANRTTLVLDLEALGDNDAHVSIPPYAGNGNPYTVTLTWVGKTPTADISLNVPPQTVDDPVFDHATFTIPNAHLKQIAGGSAVLRYSLVQQGDAVEKQSKTTSITLTGLPVELTAPVVVEAGGTDLIDLALVTGNSVTVTIAAYSGQNVGDKILLSWKGTPLAGGPVNYTDEYIIKTGEELRATTFIVPRGNLDPLADGSLELSYQVVFSATGNTQNSASMSYQVKAAVSETLPAPVVAGVAQGGVLDPAPITDGVLVIVQYDSMLATDKIRVAWFGAPSIVEIDGSASKTVQVTMPNSAVAASLGQSVVVRYGVTHAGGTESASEATQFTVGTLTESALPTPAVTEAQNGVLDLNTFSGNAHVIVPKWPLSVIGQRVWLTVSGPNGVPTYKVLESYPITSQEASNGIARDIPRAELEKFADGSALTVVCKVAFDGSNTESSAIKFPIAAYTIKTLDDSVLPTITNVTDSKGQVANGGTTFDTSVTLAGKASPNQQVQILDGSTSTGTVLVNGNGDWTHQLTSLALTSHSITAKGLYGNNPVSGARTFTVQSAIPPFVLDPSTVTLNGKVYLPAGHPAEPIPWPSNTSVVRTPTSGSPPYIYSSSNTAFASVNSAGLVSARGNGIATISVIDNDGRLGQYNVNVSGVVICHGLGNSQYPTAVSNASSRGLRIPSLQELNEIYLYYANRWPQGDNYYWSSNSAGGIPASNYIKNLVSGAQSTAYNGSFGGFANVVAI